MAKALESAVLLGCYLPTFCLVLEGVNPPPWSKQFSIFFLFRRGLASALPRPTRRGGGGDELLRAARWNDGSGRLPDVAPLRSTPRHHPTRLRSLRMLLTIKIFFHKMLLQMLDGCRSPG